MPAVAPIVLSVCTACRRDGEDESVGGRLMAALRAAELPPGIVLRPVQCLSVCRRPCTVSFAAEARYTYVFGDLDPDRDAAAVIEGIRVYAQAEHGYMLWRERPEALRRGVVARVPPPGWAEDDGRHPR